MTWRQAQLAQLENVELISNKALRADDVLEYGAELVIVATGSHWSPEGFGPANHGPIVGASANDPAVLTPENIMVDRKSVPGEQVVVYDCDGYYVGPSISEKLARDGPLRDSDHISRHDRSLHALHTRVPQNAEPLTELGVRFATHHSVSRDRRRIGAELPTCTHRQISVEWSADALVLVTQRISNDGLYRELMADDQRLLEAGIQGVYRIGDCVVPRIIAEAIFDGHRLGREIDTSDPATPLPYIRERRVLTRDGL